MYYVVCNKCSYTLYSGERAVNVLKTFQKYGDKCPRCFSRLSTEPRKIVVKGKRRPSP